MHSIIRDGVIRIEVRTISDEEGARQAAAVVAARRNAAADGVTQDGEAGYWLAKCLSAAASNTLLGLYVNEGAVAGAAVVEQANASPDLYLLATASLWDADATEPALTQAAVDLAASMNAPLWSVTHVVEVLPAGAEAVDANGAVVPGVAATRRRMLSRLG